MIAKLSEMGVTSEMAYGAGSASIGLSFLSWLLSLKKEEAGLDRADRWGLFIGEWAPTFFAIGLALRLEESKK
ncbi:hypothetical protein [Nocardiopsis quinghaiensis]|uniref:hypothetical protein n=1 Tax=Nocardiopsis quinghaiensis TaxID=464995 RepID=UPI00123BFE23|nr:hypothetical protein [Nocardiopsis quinghaiensis]